MGTSFTTMVTSEIVHPMIQLVVCCKCYPIQWLSLDMWQKVLLLEMWQKLTTWFAPNFGWIYNIPTYTLHQDPMKSVGGVMAAHRCCCSWWRWWWSGNSLWANYPAPPYTSYDHNQCLVTFKVLFWSSSVQSHGYGLCWFTSFELAFLNMTQIGQELFQIHYYSSHWRW